MRPLRSHADQPAVSYSTERDAPATCLACGSQEIEHILEIERVPVQCNVLWPTRRDALRAPVGTMQLGFCRACSHVANLAFDSSLMEYTQVYENSLHFSSRFQAYIDGLVTRLDRAYGLRGKHVIDVGCGKGEFLTDLCRRTHCTGLGFDRSYEPARGETLAPEAMVEFIVDFYGEAYASHPVDLLTCRHVLEHIAQPADFVSMIRRSLGRHAHASVFFEVPDARYTIQRLGIWDLIYEHVSYFTPQSLSMLFERCGFGVSRISSEFGGQYLTVEATYRQDHKPLPFDNVDLAPVDVQDHMRLFRSHYHRKVNEWRSRVNEVRRERGRIAVWGSGSKGVMFLNTLGIDADDACAIDINPRKAGKYIPVTGQVVVPPDDLRTIRPALVVVMNRIYEQEIRETLACLDVRTELLFA